MESQLVDRSSAYPVALDVTQTDHYDRVQLLLRLLVGVTLGHFHQSLLGVLVALYLALPALGAILISTRNGRGFGAADVTWVTGVLDWFVSFYAYMFFVTDRFPLDAASRKVRLRIASSGTPTASDALLRLLTSLPHALILAVLAVLAGLVSLIIGAFILFTERAPASLRSFQREFVSWLARVFAYHVALVDVYPPFGSAEGKTGSQRGDVTP